MNPLVTLAITELPNIIAMIRAAHATANPTAPPLTEDQVKAALLSAVASSIAKDDLWMAAHPGA